MTDDLPIPVPRKGPLTGLKIVEMTGIGPAPYAAMILADLGAQVIRIDRPGGYPAVDTTLDFAAMEAASVFYRSRPLVQVDLKTEAGRALVRRLSTRADALIEAYRPGTMERLGLGPQDLHALNPALAYTRITGWGQTGPRAQTAGHDLNYIGLSGALSLFGQGAQPPAAIPPLVGDMAGGALFAVIGLLAATMAARSGAPGQVVDAAILDGSSNLYTLIAALSAMGAHGVPGTNVLDGGRHYYRTYRCACGSWLAVGAIEPAFRHILLNRLDLAADTRFADPAQDAACTDALAAIFSSQPRDHWLTLFDGTDGCVTAVLSPAEAATDPHNASRTLFETLDGVIQPAPAPRLSATPGAISLSPRAAARPDPQALAEWGLTAQDIADAQADGAFGPPSPE